MTRLIGPLLVAILFVTPVIGQSKAAAEIRKILEDQTAAWNRGDIDAFMSIGYWRSDKLKFISGDKITSGWQQTLDNYKRTYSTREKMGTLTFSDLEIDVLAKDAAVVHGSWRLQRTTDEPKGKFTLIFRKFKEGWRIVTDHTSQETSAGTFQIGRRKTTFMKSHAVFLLLFIGLFSSTSFAQAEPAATSAFERVDANPRAGFAYPYYLYVPAEVKQASAAKTTHTLLVLPNNTGSGPNDDFAVHENDVKRRIAGAAAIANLMKVGVLMPVFPRPATDWRTYTLALDRDSLTTTKAEYRRFDLQLIAMIDDARARLKKNGLAFDKKVLLNGFSAQAMFANRFTFLHPDRVKAAAIGSPGGWPIAPVATYNDKKLRYPIGIADIKAITGKNLEIKELKKVPLFLFIGDKDTNDSVPFGDSYDDEDRELINPLFGKTPVERWGIAEKLYKDAGLNATFKTYADVAHTVSPTMREDIRDFLLKHK